MAARNEDQGKKSNKGRLAGKVAIVTGSAEGMGEATAKLFAQEGAKVIVADINETKGKQVAEHICQRGGEAVFIRLDVANEENWKYVMSETVKKYGKLNILVNNAGIIKIADVEDTSLEDWHRILDVNATGPFLGTKLAILTMKVNAEPCSIINRSSIAGQIGDKNMFAYCASKGAVTLMTKSAALSCADRNYKIRVNSVHPAYVSTNMTRGEASQLGISEEEYMQGAKAFHPIGLGEPIDVAYLDLYLASDESKWVTGAEFTIDGGATAQ
jgi:NAD(P)-dependent dehydrogenase (short-subunit alcohol dehydrogenase family)